MAPGDLSYRALAGDVGDAEALDQLVDRVVELPHAAAFGLGEGELESSTRSGVVGVRGQVLTGRRHLVAQSAQGRGGVPEHLIGGEIE